MTNNLAFAASAVVAGILLGSFFSVTVGQEANRLAVEKCAYTHAQRMALFLYPFTSSTPNETFCTPD